MTLCVLMLLLALGGGGSRVAVSQTGPVAAGGPAPPAWAMQEQSTSVEKLDKLFSISAPTSSASAQP